MSLPSEGASAKICGEGGRIVGAGSMTACGDGETAAVWAEICDPEVPAESMRAKISALLFIQAWASSMVVVIRSTDLESASGELLIATSSRTN